MYYRYSGNHHIWTLDSRSHSETRYKATDLQGVVVELKDQLVLLTDELRTLQKEYGDIQLLQEDQL